MLQRASLLYALLWNDEHSTVFIHSSADKHLDCFHFWTPMDNVDIKCSYIFCVDTFSFLLGLYLREFLDHLMTLCLTF